MISVSSKDKKWKRINKPFCSNVPSDEVVIVKDVREIEVKALLSSHYGCWETTWASPLGFSPTHFKEVENELT